MPTASKNAETIVIHTSYRSDPATTSVADGEVADWVSHAVALFGPRKQAGRADDEHRV